MKTSSLLALVTLASASLAPRAHAHINATLGDATGRNGNMKDVPCDGAKGAGPVLTYAPGATVELKVDEFIPHPGYFRISFDADGGDDFVEPRSIDPLDGQRQCPYNNNAKLDKCDGSDFCNSETVLLDNLAPHVPNLLSGGSSYT